MTRSKARTAGAIYLLYFLVAIPAAAAIGHVPAALGVAANLLANALYVVVAVLLYRIFTPVNRGIAVLAAIAGVFGCVVQSASLFQLTSPNSALPVFGLFNLIVGYLILKSTFLPRVLGMLMSFSGVGWLLVLSPAVVSHASIPIELLGIVAEGALMLWLLFKGVDVERWNAQAAIQRQRSPGAAT